MYQYEMFELSLTGEPPQGSQALFTFQTVFQLDGEEKTVKGFYAGSNTYKVRFLPKKPAGIPGKPKVLFPWKDLWQGKKNACRQGPDDMVW